MVNGDDYMEARLQKWGNSDGIRIPKSILKSLGLKTDDKVNIDCSDDKIIITKLTRLMSLEERFANYKGPNLAKEFEWDEPMGKEIW